jgi:hypothetical protein
VKSGTQAVDRLLGQCGIRRNQITFRPVPYIAAHKSGGEHYGT